MKRGGYDCIHDIEMTGHHTGCDAAEVGVAHGDEARFCFNERDHIEVVPLVNSVSQLKGMVPKPSRVLSVDDMDAAVAEGAGR